MFTFLDPGKLVNAGLELVLTRRYPGNHRAGHVPVYRFKMAYVGKDEEVGRIELRVGNTHHIVTYAGHIGYRVNPEHRGHRHAATACRLLLPLARRHSLKTIWITCNPDNIASRRTCELAGAVFIEIVDLPESTNMYKTGERRKCRYRLDLCGDNSRDEGTR